MRIRQLRSDGIPVTEWHPERPLDVALASLARRAPLARAAL